MKEKTLKLIDEILKRNDLEYLKNDLINAINESIKRINKGGKIIICGNGGSCSDAMHIAGELEKGFVLSRKLSEEDKNKVALYDKYDGMLKDKLQYGIPAVALSGTDSISTAVMNDNGAEMVFAQQVYALGCENDVLIGISTSGNAVNVYNAMVIGKAKGLYLIGLSGKTGGKLKEIADSKLVIRLDETYRIQEKHLPTYHLYCLAIENELYGD